MSPRSRLMTVEDALRFLKPGDKLALGGALNSNRPATFVRALIRQGTGDLTLCSSPGSAWDCDLLIGAGLVKEAWLPMVTFVGQGMAPCFRGAVESGKVKARLIDLVGTQAGFLAGAMKHPYQLVLSLDGTNCADDDELFETLTDSKGNRFRAARAIVPDLCVLHVEEADELGNVRHLGGRVADVLMAMAARVTIVEADRIVPHEEVLREPRRTTLSRKWVTGVIHAPFGAHPCATALYGADEAHLGEYLKAAEAKRTGDPAPFEAYLRKYVLEPGTPEEYRRAVGGSALEQTLQGQSRHGLHD